MIGFVFLVIMVSLIIALTADKRLLGENIYDYCSIKNGSLLDYFSYLEAPLFVSGTVLWTMVQLFGELLVLYYISNAIVLLSLSVSVLFVFKSIKNSDRYFICALFISTLFICSYGIFFISSIHFYLSAIILCWTAYFFKKYLNEQSTKNLVVFSAFLLVSMLNSLIGILLLPFAVIFYFKVNNKRLSLIYSISTSVIMIGLSYSLLFIRPEGFRNYLGHGFSLFFEALGVPFAFDDNLGIQLVAIYSVVGAFSLIAALLFLNQIIMALYSLVKSFRYSYKTNLVKWCFVFGYALLFIFISPLIRTYNVLAIIMVDFVLLLFVNYFYNPQDFKNMKKHSTSLLAVAISIPMIVTSLGSSAYYKNEVITKEAQIFDERQAMIDNLEPGITLFGSHKEASLYSYHLEKSNSANASSINVIDDNGLPPSLSRDEYENNQYYYINNHQLTEIEDGLNIHDTWIEGTVFEKCVFSEKEEIELVYYVPFVYPSNSMRVYVAEKLVYKDINFNGLKNTTLKLPKNNDGHVVNIRIECDHTVIPDVLYPGTGDLRSLSVTLVHFVA